MAQSRAKRQQRRNRPTANGRPSATPTATRRRTVRRLVIAFIILIGLAGIFAVAVPDGDPSGQPPPIAPVG